MSLQATAHNLKRYKVRNRILKYCQQYKPLFTLNGKDLPPEQQNKLKAIGIGPRRWTHIIRNESELSLEEFVNLYLILEPKNFFELIELDQAGE